MPHRYSGSRTDCEWPDPPHSHKDFPYLPSLPLYPRPDGILTDLPTACREIHPPVTFAACVDLRTSCKYRSERPDPPRSSSLCPTLVQESTLHLSLGTLLSRRPLCFSVHLVEWVCETGGIWLQHEFNSMSSVHRPMFISIHDCSFLSSSRRLVANQRQASRTSTSRAALKSFQAAIIESHRAW